MSSSQKDENGKTPNPTTQSIFDVLRKWLTKNEIFFKTVAAIFLSLMAIFVSVLQISLNSDQNKLMERQTELAELQTKVAIQEITPQFVISAKQLDEYGIGYASEDKIFVNNLGGIVSELSSQYAVFFEIELTPIDPRKGDQIKISMPINGYYSATGHSPAGKGKLLTILGYKNNEKASKFKKEFSDYASEKGFYGFITINRYLHLSYLDQLGVRHKNYYFIPLIYGANQLSKEEGENTFRRFDEGFNQNKVLDLDKISAKILFEKVVKL